MRTESSARTRSGSRISHFSYGAVLCALALCAALTALCAPRAAAREPERSTFDMSLEELLGTTVTSVTRLPDRSVFNAPAAIYVISQEDIRRSGLMQIPEILRLAPAMQVERVDAGTWSISARGFNNRYNRLQRVQMDGRPLTDILFGGVYWANQDAVIDDLDRIEVISGPGASLWGSNAINGVISIISKPARETQGWLVKSHTGDAERGIGTIRYGGRLGPDTFFRLYAKHEEHGNFDTYAYNNALYNSPYVNQYTEDKSDDLYSYQDGYRRQQFGFRADWENRGADSFTLQGDAYRLMQGDSIAYANYTVLANPLGLPPSGYASQKEADGWNVLGRWNRELSETSGFKLQMFVDWNAQKYLNPLTPHSDKKRVSEIDFQHYFRAGRGHDILWGAQYRHDRMRVSTNMLTYTPETDSFNNETISGFVQDSFKFLSPEMLMTLGAKIEKNDFTGEELQPSMRLTYTPNQDNVVWTAVSKAVKVPGNETRANYNVGGANVPANSLGAGNPPIDMWMPFTLQGNPRVQEEEFIAYELGYRTRPGADLTLDMTAFAHRGHHLQRTEVVTAVPYVVTLVSKGVAHYEGFELSATWTPAPRWRLAAGYTWFSADEKTAGALSVSDETPRNQAQLRSYYDINPNLEFNTALYYQDNIRHPDIKLPKSMRLDAGLTWKNQSKGYECKVWGRNLIDPKYREGFPDRYSSLGAAQVERNFSIEMNWNLP